MKKSDPLISIITINYNQTDVTRQLLDSLYHVTYPNTEIIVVDNGSNDDSCRMLATEFPHIKLIVNGENLGFAGGNNVGLEAASGDYLLLINNDVEVTPDFLQPLLATFHTYPNTGMASPKILFHNRGELIQFAGSTGINKWTGRGKKIGAGQHDTGQFDEVKETKLIHGACVMVSRRLLESIGPLYEDYFLYYEEHDWAERAKKAGFQLFYVGTSKVYHKESMSTGKNSPLKTYYLTRSRLIYLKRNTKFPNNFSSFLIFALIAIPKNLLKYIGRLDYKNMKAFIEAILWHLGWKDNHYV